MEDTKQVGIIFPEILIPEKKINKQKWAVIACDQFTSNEDYWIKTSKAVGGSPSTLHIIVPEAHLNDSDVSERVGHAKQTMNNYLEDGVLVRLPKGVILVERETPSGTRVGLVLAIDLDQYDIDYRKKPLIRATEQTVTDRIPPRMALREGASIECPHVMLLINDPKDRVIAPVYEARAQFPKVYDTPLIQGGGHIKGWFIDDPDMLGSILDALEWLKKKALDGMLFAVGDGNHSLASAKAVWERHKLGLTEEQAETDPLRYALVEVVNLYDNGISIFPIHRVLFNVDVSSALRMLVSILNSQGQEATMMYTRGTRITQKEGVQIIQFESKMAKGHIEIKKPSHELMSHTLTLALDELLKELPRARVDYIHGDEEFHNLSKGHASLGFQMEPMSKEELFNSVVEYGVLPKKAFSMGNAEEKRYYFECRLLVDTDEEEEPEQEPEQQPEQEEMLEPAPEKSDMTEEERTPAPQPIEEAQPGEMVIDEPMDNEYEEPDEDQAPRRKKFLWFGRKKDQE